MVVKEKLKQRNRQGRDKTGELKKTLVEHMRVTMQPPFRIGGNSSIPDCSFSVNVWTVRALNFPLHLYAALWAAAAKGEAGGGTTRTTTTTEGVASEFLERSNRSKFTQWNLKRSPEGTETCTRPKRNFYRIYLTPVLEQCHIYMPRFAASCRYSHTHTQPDTHNHTVANTFICWPVGGNEWVVACGVLAVWPEVPRSSNYMCTHTDTWAACVCVRVWSVIHSFLQINEPYTKTNKFNWITLLGIAIECSRQAEEPNSIGILYRMGFFGVASSALELPLFVLPYLFVCVCDSLCVCSVRLEKILIKMFNLLQERKTDGENEPILSLEILQKYITYTIC